MRELVTFDVIGPAIPQGSMIPGITKKGKPFARHSNPSLLQWRRTCALMATVAMRSARAKMVRRYGAIEIHFSVFVERGNKTRKYPTARTDGGDIDKLERALLDALTGVCFEDDSMVIDVKKSMRFAPTAGMRVQVFSDDEEE